MKIYLNPGHGGSDPGAVYGNRAERDDVLRLAKRVGDLLEGAGHKVRFSRTTNAEEPSISWYCEDANDWGADVFLAIHRNAFRPNGASGVEAWINSHLGSDSASYQLASRIIGGLVSCGFNDRGVKKGTPRGYQDYGVNRLTDMPSTLIEVGFVDSDTDNRIFDDRFEQMAQAIASGAVGKTVSAAHVKPTSHVAKPAPKDLIRVQVGAYASETNAKAMIVRLKDAGFSAYMVGGKTEASTKIAEDGYLGSETTMALQKHFGTPVDGIISEPSQLVLALQKWLGVAQDGYWGKITTSALQRRMGTVVDGVIDRPSPCIKELQRRLNAGNFN